jgi:peptidoglycan/xylan/chitin deacetylase (PgdA/CDA1 family)
MGELMSDPLVLAYHAISQTWPATLATSPNRLQAQLETLLRQGYQGETFAKAVHATASDDEGAGGEDGDGDADGDRALAVTFDDAFRSVIERAFPIMQSLGVTGTVFVPTDYVGQDHPMHWRGIDQWLGTKHEDELACMSWDELKQLSDAGWEIASHTCSHPHLTEIGDEQLRDELVRSRETISERIGAPCRTIAYPFGDHDGRVEQAVRDAGYEAAGGVRPGPRNLWAWPRIGVYPADGPLRFRVKASKGIRRARGSHLGTLLQRARGMRT